MTESVAHIGDTGSVHGIVTEPVKGTQGRDYPVVIFLNAGLTHRIGPRRIHVQLARCLSESGVTSLRLDLSGIGDSEARRDGLPARESALLEIQAAMDYLTDRTGSRRFVLFGICSGADHAFRVGRVDPRVVGLVLVNGYTYRTVGNYVRHYGRRLMRARSWLNVLQGRHPLWHRLTGRGTPDPSPPREPQLGFYRKPPRREADADLRSMLDRGVTVCVVHSHEESYNHHSQFKRAFPSARKDTQVEVEYIDYADHTFTLLAAQDRLLHRVESWLVGADWSS